MPPWKKTFTSASGESAKRPTACWYLLMSIREKIGRCGGQAFIDVITVFMLDFSNFLDIFKTGDVLGQCFELLLELCDFSVRHGGNWVTGIGGDFGEGLWGEVRLLCPFL